LQEKLKVGSEVLKPEGWPEEWPAGRDFQAVTGAIMGVCCLVAGRNWKTRNNTERAAEADI
jgi:hypothetical protein